MRLNAFSKKFEMHAHSIAIHYPHYSFVKIHQRLTTTPVMTGVTDRLPEMSDLVALVDGQNIQ